MAPGRTENAMRVWTLFLVLLLAGAASAPGQHLRARLQRLPVAPQAPALRAPDTTAALGVEDHRAPARTYHPWRLWLGVAGYAAIDVPVMYGLTQLWYDEESRTSFHWYSDSDNATVGGRLDDGWLDDWNTYVQQDKLGHLTASWHLARIFGAYGRWSGLSDGKAGLFGAVMSTAFQTQVEIYDGFDENYGASRTDLLANAVGAIVGGLKVAYPERLGWFEAKYSYHVSSYYDASKGSNAAFRYLGNAIKDYDGISYWFVVRPDELLTGDAQQRWPDWLGLSVGYTADGIEHALSGQREARLGPGAGTEHRRVLLVGPDLDLLHFAAEHAPEPWASFADALSFIRIPAPALQVASGLKVHWLYW